MGRCSRRDSGRAARLTMTPYTTEALNALLSAAGLSAYAAAKLIGLSPRAMQDAAAGTTRLSEQSWRLLQVTVSRSARRALPKAVLP